eukprot:TRINITY_DN11098_c0_g1_i6.p1 TRINITY_DN11098_c0_g1~~TRINITY_DN11098_c0_g1_i6.p1  ORF type:complete len:348 (+),score=87.65 TRINITY_DN11098_c0_g1_i6:97-1140(+)
MDPLDVPKNRILDISFNQEQDCFAVSTESGFHIFEANPPQELFSRDLGGGIGATAMLFRSNILALVGGGDHPKYSDNKLILWNNLLSQSIAELTFKSAIKSIKLRKEKLVVVLELRIYIYQMPDLNLVDVIETSANPQGACAITHSGNMIIVCPDKKKGGIKMVNYNNVANAECRAHESGIGAIAISKDGKLCATASDKGTIIRVYATEGLVLLQELRRGTEKAEIQTIAFDEESQWLACTSDRGTIHIFSLADSYKAVYEEKGLGGREEKKDTRPVFNFMKGITTYFNSQRSFAQFRIPDSRSAVAFGPKGTNTITVVTYDGKCYTAEFSPKSGGECRKFTKRQFL